MQSSKPRIEISVAEQCLRLLDGDKLTAEYAVSTGQRGLGTEEGSFKTPTGQFEICEKIGDGTEVGTIFKGRKPIGSWKPGDTTEGDLVLSRILWLDGIDSDNTNTRDRYIYIHGTNQEELIGQPASEGCIRMKNNDVLDLFNRIPTRTSVSIA